MPSYELLSLLYAHNFSVMYICVCVCVDDYISDMSVDDYIYMCVYVFEFYLVCYEKRKERGNITI